MENDKLFELMSKMYGEMQEGFQKVDNEMQEGFQKVDNEIKDIKARIINIENDHGKKLDMLFDGYKQNAEQLNRIEKEVTKHEEIILRRVK